MEGQDGITNRLCRPKKPGGTAQSLAIWKNKKMTNVNQAERAFRTWSILTECAKNREEHGVKP